MTYKKKKAKKKIKDPIQLSINITLKREDMGWSQEVLAEKAGMKQQRIAYLEKSSDSKVSAYTKVAEKGFGMAFEDLAIYHLTRKKDEKK